MGLYALIFTIWNVLGFCVFLNIPKVEYSIFSEMYHPREIYKEYNVNKFGSVLISLGFGLICPVLYIVWWICHFIYWICTVGRE